MYEIFPFLKQAEIAIYFLSLLMIIELLSWNRKERWSSVGHVLFNQSGFQQVSGFVRMKEDHLLIATGMMNKSKFFKNIILNIYLFEL